MKNVCEIKEISHNQAAKSLVELKRETAQPWKTMVLEYLRAGKRGAIAPGIQTDVISGEKIPGALITMTDGEYFWRSDLIYYIEKYNLEIDSVFISKVLRRGKKLE